MSTWNEKAEAAAEEEWPEPGYDAHRNSEREDGSGDYRGFLAALVQLAIHQERAGKTGGTYFEVAPVSDWTETSSENP